MRGGAPWSRVKLNDPGMAVCVVGLVILILLRDRLGRGMVRIGCQECYNSCPLVAGCSVMLRGELKRQLKARCVDISHTGQVVLKTVGGEVVIPTSKSLLSL